MAVTVSERDGMQDKTRITNTAGKKLQFSATESGSDG